MKKYSSPIMKILTMERADIVMLSSEYIEENTKYYEDIWGDRFPND